MAAPELHIKEHQTYTVFHFFTPRYSRSLNQGERWYKALPQSVRIQLLLQASCELTHVPDVALGLTTKPEV